MEEKEIVCKECDETFVLSAEEQTWYQEKGYAEPKRCPMCRRLKRQGLIGKEKTYGKK